MLRPKNAFHGLPANSFINLYPFRWAQIETKQKSSPEFKEPFQCQNLYKHNVLNIIMWLCGCDDGYLYR